VTALLRAGRPAAAKADGATDRRPGVRASTRDETLAVIVREGVLAQILDGRLRPGTMISTAALAREYGTSKMPVRDALTALKRDGLMDSIPYRGFVVRAIDVHDIAEVNFVREILECAAAGLAAAHITTDQVRRLKALEEHDIARLHRAAIGLEPDTTSGTFHAVIADASKNRRLAQLIKRLLQDVHRSQYAALSVAEIEDNHREHFEIIAALERRDSDGSVETMRRHLQNIERRGRDALSGKRQAARISAPRAVGGAASGPLLGLVKEGGQPPAVPDQDARA